MKISDRRLLRTQGRSPSSQKNKGHMIYVPVMGLLEERPSEEDKTTPARPAAFHTPSPMKRLRPKSSGVRRKQHTPESKHSQPAVSYYSKKS